MRLGSKPGVVPVLLAALIVLPTVLIAGAEGKGGFFDASYDRSGKVGTRFVQWLWWPYYDVGSLPYVVYAVCERYDADGQPVGNNKITFDNIVLRGVDTNTEVAFRKRSVKLRNGTQPEVVTWDAGELRTIANETVLIGRGDVKVKGKIAPGDYLHCEIGTAEIT